MTKETKENSKGTVTIRELQARKDNGSIQNVTQIHYTDWPDHGVPEQSAFGDFELMLNHFIKWNLQSDATEKSIVHCSAGIGRTGTTVSLMEMIINICAQRNEGVQDPLLSPFHTVRRLRE